MSAPERIWLLWADGTVQDRYHASAKDHTEEGGYPEFIRADLHEAAVATARAEGRENAMQALAALGQAQEAYEAQTAIAAELAAAQQRLENGLKWCDLMDGPVSKSQFVNGQATAAQQIRAALRAESSK